MVLLTQIEAFLTIADTAARTAWAPQQLPVGIRRVAGRRYFFVEGPEFMDVTPAVKIIEEALAGKRPQ